MTTLDRIGLRGPGVRSRSRRQAAAAPAAGPSRETRWEPVIVDAPVWFHEYAWPHGRATSMLFEVAEGQLACVSPPSTWSRDILAQTRRKGEVAAIVANSAAHDSGLARARAFFPRASFHASASAATRLARRMGPGIAWRPMRDLLDRAGARLEALDAPGARLGDVILRLRTRQGWVWHASDLVGNGSLPEIPVVRQLFRWSGSGPGFKVNRLLLRLYVRDRRRLLAWLIDELERRPPAALVCAHGPPVVRPDLAPVLRRMLLDALGARGSARRHGG